MIKLELLELRAIMEGLNTIMTDHLPIKASYWVSKLAKKIDKEFGHSEEARMLLVKKYGELDENGNLISKGSQYNIKDRLAFDKEFNDLMKTEIDLDFNKIPLSLFGDADVTPASLLALDKFIDETK